MNKSYAGYAIETDTIPNANELYRFIEDYELSAEEVFNLFVNWHGTQLCTEEFLENTFRVEYDLDED